MKETKLFKVYYHMNLLNHMYYIDITSKSVNQRWGKNGSGYNDQYIGNAIQKYGWNNFEHVILYDNLSEYEAKLKEQELIKQYNSIYPNGYNMTCGGDIMVNDIICIETGEIIQFEDIDNYIISHNDLFHGKLYKEDIIDCCKILIKKIKIPWKNKYLHYQYVKNCITNDPEEYDKNFNYIVSKRKFDNHNVGIPFKRNNIRYVRNNCKYCGKLFTYNYDINLTHRKNYCDKCLERKNRNIICF